MSLITDILTRGAETGATPEEMSQAIDLAHADITRELGTVAASEQDRFRALSKLDDDRNDAIAQLRTQAMGRELVKQFPDPVERQAFLYTASNIKAENQGRSQYPAEYEQQARAINSVGETFAERKRNHGTIEFGPLRLGSFVERPLGGNSFQFLLQPADKDVEFPGTGIKVGTKEQEPLTRTVSVDRNALIRESEAAVKAYDDPGAFSSDELALYNGPRLRQEETLLKFRQTAPINDIARMEMIRGLKDDPQFKDTIPNNWVEQFTVRPVLKVVQGFGRTGAAIAGDTETLLEPDPIDFLAPGALRNRFENKGGGEPTADLISQGVESLITYLTPGAIAKVAGKVLPLVGLEAGLAGNLAASNLAGAGGKLGFAGFGTTAFGNSYADRLQLAERTTDPVEADRIRAWAPFLAAADAVKEMITEKLIPGDVESLIAKGLSGSLAKRLVNAGLIAPAKEGLEEVAGVGLEQLYAGTPGTPESQSPFQAFRGGFLGGLAFAPAAFFGRDVKEQPDGTAAFNGQVFDSLELAEQARKESLARVKDTLEPLGIKTQEDAVAYLADLDRRELVSEDETRTAQQVVLLAPLLQKESAPSPVGQAVEEGAATSGVPAAEGIAPVAGPAGGLQEAPAAAGVVNPEISAPVQPQEAPAQAVPTVPGVTAPATPAAPVQVQQPVTPEPIPEPVISEPAPVPTTVPQLAATRAEDINRFAPNIQYFENDGSTPAGQVISKFSEVSGTKVILFDSDPNPSGRTTDGFVIPGDPNTIYMRRNTVQPFLHVLAHEFYHNREDMPQYQEFATSLQTLEPEAWSRAQQQWGDTPKALSEFVADVVGSRFTQREFWDRMQKEMPRNLFQQFVEYVRGIWDRIKQQMGPRYVEVQNAAEIDKMLADLLPLQRENPAPGNTVFPDSQRQEGIAEFKKQDILESQPRIQVEPKGRQSGFGIVDDLDLYNVVAPGTSVDGTTFAVPVGSTEDVVQQRAREKFTEANEPIPQSQEIKFSEIDSNLNIPFEAQSGSTQVATTTGTYGKAADILADVVPPGGKVLDYGAGLGLGADVLRETLETVETFEVNPERWQSETLPTYTQSAQVQGPYDGVVNLNVLNVVPKGIRDSIVQHIGSLLKPGGQAIIGVRKWEGDVNRAKGVPGAEPKSIVIAKKAGDTFQKGFDGNELVEYLQNQLGDGFTVRKLPGVTANGVVLTKNPVPIPQSDVPTPFDSTRNNAVLKVGGFWLEGGITDYPAWREKVLADLGPNAEPFLRGTYENLRHTAGMPADRMTSSFDIDRPGPQVREAPQLSPVDEQTLKEGGTGTKNAATDFLRTLYGVEAADEVTRETHEEVLQVARDKLTTTPDLADNLINEMTTRRTEAGQPVRELTSPRALNQYEEAVLMLENMKLQKQYEEASVALAEAEKKGDLTEKGNQMRTVVETRAKLQALYDIERATGTIWGRTGNFRRRLLARDYSLARMQYNYQAAANQGGQLTSTQSATVQAAHDKISTASKDVEKAEDANLEARLLYFMEQFITQRNAIAATITPDKLGPQAAAARFRLKSALKPQPAAPADIQQSSTLSPELLNDLSIVGAEYLQSGATSLEQFQRNLESDFGDQFNDSVQFIYDASVDLLNAISKGRTRNKAARKKGAAQATVDIAAAAGQDEPDRKMVKDLVQIEVEGGTTGTKDVFNNVLAALQPVFPNLTLRRLKEIFTNYGNAIFPSQEEIKKQLRELHRLAMLEVTLERIQTNLPALKSGPQRDKASAEVRSLQRQINDTKKTLGLDQKTEAQLAGALTAAKTRLQNRNEDLKRFIAAGGRTDQEKAPRPGLKGDDELKALKAESERLTDILEALESKKPLSFDRRVALTLKALEEEEAELTRRLENQEFTSTRKAKDIVTSEDIEERRSYNATLRAALKEGAAALKVRKTPVQRALDRATAALENWEKILDGRKSPPDNSPRPALSQEEEDLRLQVSAMRQLVAEENKAKRDAKKPSEAQKRINVAQKMLEDAEKAFDTFIATGALPSVPTRRKALTQTEEDLQLKAAAIRQLLSEQRQDREAPAKRVEAAKKERDRLAGVLEGTEAERPGKSPQVALTQAEEDLKLEIDAMRRVIAEEKRAKKLKPQEQKQLEAAQRALAKLEALLAGGTPPVRNATVPLTEAEEEVRAQILTAKNELAAARAADPAWQLRRDKNIIVARTNALQARLDHGDFSKKPPKVKATDADLAKKRAKYIEVRNEWERQLFEAGLASRSLPKKVIGTMGSVLLASRLFQLGLDFGILLRQGGAAIGRPGIILSAAKVGANSLTDAGRIATEEELKKNPLYALSLQAGVAYTNWDNDSKLANQEELYHSRFLNRLEVKPTDSDAVKALKTGANLVTGPVRGLGQAQVNAINQIRLQWFEAMYYSMSRSGAPSLDEMQHMAVMINVSTGRGNLADWEAAATKYLSYVFLAYRWGRSTFQYVTLHPLWWPIYKGIATKRSTALVAKEMGRRLTGLALMYVSFAFARALNQGGDDDDKWKIEWDPRSSRFGKIPIGDSLLDPTAGISQWVTLLSKVATRRAKTNAGEVISLIKRPGEEVIKGEALGDHLSRFFRYKLNPVVGATWSSLTEKDPVGQKTDAINEANRLVTPLIFKDVSNAIQQNGVPKGLALSVAAFFGMGVSSFEDKSRENITTEDRAWLYNTGVSYPKLSDDTTVGSMIGLEKRDAERQGLDRPVTEDERRAVLQRSLPDAQAAMLRARERYKDLPVAGSRREARVKQLESELATRVQRARARAYRELQR